MAPPVPEGSSAPPAPTSVPADADPDAVAGASAMILPPPKTDLGGAFVKGMIWSSLALIISKVSSLLATLGLAFVFGEAEYGAFAAARSAAIIGDVLTDGGMRRVLISRGDEFPRIARTAFRVALGFNLLGCALMCGTATFIHRSDVASQIVVTAIALVIGTLGSMQRAKLVTDLRFARSAFMYTISAVLRSALTVAFAWSGLGPLSFALPILFVAIWEAIYARYAVGPLPLEPTLLETAHRQTLAAQLISQSKWVIFATLGTSLVARGDYLVASLFFGNETVASVGGGTEILNVAGRYMFAFQLTLALFSPLTMAMETVIQPVMAQLRSDPLRGAGAFLRMVRVGVFLAVPASLVSVGLAPALLHPIRNGYWDTAAIAVQILAATECVRHLYQISFATLEANGRFRTSAIVVTLDGVLTVLAAAIGCYAGGTLLSLTIAVAIQRTLTAIGHAVYTYGLAGGRPSALLLQIVPPLAIGALVGVTLGWAARISATGETSHRWLLVGAAALSVPIYFALARLLTPLRFAESAEMLLSRLRRRRSDAI